MTPAKMLEQTVTFTLTGAPRTKKTSSRLVRAGGRAVILPSAAYAAWNRLAQIQLARVRAAATGLPLAGNVNVRALIYREALIGDATGFYQAIADTLQEGGVVVNDRQIVSWDGSRLLKDAAEPRVEIEISEA